MMTKKEKIIIKLVQKQFYNAKKISLSNSAKILKTETPSLCEKFRLDQRSDYNVCRRKTTVKTIALGGGRLVRYPSIAQQVAFTPIPVKKKPAHAPHTYNHGPWLGIKKIFFEVNFFKPQQRYPDSKDPDPKNKNEKRRR